MAAHRSRINLPSVLWDSNSEHYISIDKENKEQSMLDAQRNGRQVQA